jgi:hypothetical protein
MLGHLRKCRRLSRGRLDELCALRDAGPLRSAYSTATVSKIIQKGPRHADSRICVGWPNARVKPLRLPVRDERGKLLMPSMREIGGCRRLTGRVEGAHFLV